ncbi:hypothetical protein ACFYRY_18585 [Streptomyces sp. NPDC005263]|uniref:hypothetical protein n=1 Tax=Streptomyces sp. NPDC005263 TaxID=3364711 RepID=UPI0036918E44
MIDDGTGLFTIGELAQATGLTVRTIRYRTPAQCSTLQGAGVGRPRRDDVHKVLAGEALRAGIAPGAPEADEVLRSILGDADLDAVLERVEAASTRQLARYRELAAAVRGLEPQSAYAEEFSWVVAALRVRAGG